jgi:hypothetical protein
LVTFFCYEINDKINYFDTATSWGERLLLFSQFFSRDNIKEVKAIKKV